MTEEILEKSLKIILSKLEGINFALMGSTNLQIQGLPVDARDLDFVINESGLQKISKLLEPQILETKKDSNGIHYESVFAIDNMEYDFVCGELAPTRRENFKNHIIFVNKFGLKIPAMALEYELEIYKKLNREKDQDKIRLIKDRMKT